MLPCAQSYPLCHQFISAGNRWKVIYHKPPFHNLLREQPTLASALGSSKNPSGSCSDGFSSDLIFSSSTGAELGESKKSEKCSMKTRITAYKIIQTDNISLDCGTPQTCCLACIANVNFRDGKYHELKTGLKIIPSASCSVSLKINIRQNFIQQKISCQALPCSIHYNTL
mgnify:CR=1 FL=1